ncbi:MAG: glycosyltransferase family 2 protein [Beijerinckiaceae bacterium]|nr:glycosyltransferase family 2 protein [Beijerinckiaceae bacterium]
MPSVSVSVIVPAYNEEKTIVEVLRQVRAQSIDGVSFEVIVIDDGSRDATVATLERHPDLYDVLVKQPQNGGKGAAVIAGLKKATGDYILFQDADLEYSPDEYKDLLYPVTAFGAEIVMGSRFMAPKYSRVQYFANKIGNRTITFIFDLFFNATFTDIYSCYLLYKRDLVDPDELISFKWEQHAEILCRAFKRAKIVYEVPISYHGRSYAEGKKIRATDIFPVIGMIIRRRFGK